MALNLNLGRIAVSSFFLAVTALSPSCAPGENFNLSPFSLQLPIGSPGSPTSISSSQLQGCSGYQDPGHHYFFTESGDGAMVMKVPGDPSTGCVTTPNSEHCRTELEETQRWQPTASKNRMAVTLAVEQPDNSEYGTVIGQIHIDSSQSTKPVCELYYNTDGDINMGIEQTRAGDNEKFTSVGNVPVGQQFSYEIRYETNVLSISINNGTLQTLPTYSLNAPLSYFKVGNYNQGSGASPSDVHFFAISISH